MIYYIDLDRRESSPEIQEISLSLYAFALKLNALSCNAGHARLSLLGLIPLSHSVAKYTTAAMPMMLAR